MKTKFNFNSQVCTDKNQSERLLALGLKKETADMYITNMSKKGLNYTDDFQIGSIPYCDVMSFWDSKGLQLEKTVWSIIPAWSLHRLMSMLTAKRKCLLIRVEADLYDVLIDRIEHVIKEGYFNKEYLCEK